MGENAESSKLKVEIGVVGLHTCRTVFGWCFAEYIPFLNEAARQVGGVPWKHP